MIYYVKTPFYLCHTPATAQTLLTKYGLFDIDDYNERTTSPLSFSHAIPQYPLLNKQCINTNTQRSVFIVLTDEQVTTQQLQNFSNRTNSNNYQFNNHVDSALLTDAWFNLFYALPSIYQQDILTQQTKPLLFQAINQQNMITSFTLVDSNSDVNAQQRNESKDDEQWFTTLFDEKNYLNDISSLIFF